MLSRNLLLEPMIIQDPRFTTKVTNLDDEPLVSDSGGNYYIDGAPGALCCTLKRKQNHYN